MDQIGRFVKATTGPGVHPTVSPFIPTNLFAKNSVGGSRNESKDNLNLWRYVCRFRNDEIEGA